MKVISLKQKHKNKQANFLTRVKKAATLGGALGGGLGAATGHWQAKNTHNLNVMTTMRHEKIPVFSKRSYIKHLGAGALLGSIAGGGLGGNYVALRQMYRQRKSKNKI